MAKKRYYDGMYGSMDERRALETRDRNMIPGDRGVANMPQKMVYAPYPATPYNGYEGLNDSISGIDRQMKDDLKKKKKETFPEKY